MKRVFVSYSRQNLDVVTQLIQDLQAVGVQAWYDQTLTGGQRWWDDILSNIRECDIFIFALSRESWESEACRGELAYVLQLSKVVLPVLVADGINLNLLPPPINQIQVTDYRQCDKAAAFALVSPSGRRRRRLRCLTRCPRPQGPRLLHEQSEGADRFHPSH